MCISACGDLRVRSRDREIGCWRVAALERLRGVVGGERSSGKNNDDTLERELNGN